MAEGDGRSAYQGARSLAKKYLSEHSGDEAHGYLPVLEDRLHGVEIMGEINLGLHEIPGAMRILVHPDVAPSNAFIGNFLRLMLLERFGMGQRILDETKDYFAYMADRTGTLWENDTPAASCCHGFASYVAALLAKSVVGVEVDLRFIQQQLNHRRPGQNALTTSRKEDDTLEILSGVFEGKTTGTPIGFIESAMPFSFISTSAAWLTSSGSPQIFKAPERFTMLTRYSFSSSLIFSSKLPNRLTACSILSTFINCSATITLFAGVIHLYFYKYKYITYFVKVY